MILRIYKKWAYYRCSSLGRYAIKMKPVLRFEEDGKIHPHEKCVRKRAFKSLESNVFELIKDLDEVTVFVIDGDKKKMDKHFTTT